MYQSLCFKMGRLARNVSLYQKTLHEHIFESASEDIGDSEGESMGECLIFASLLFTAA